MLKTPIYVLKRPCWELDYTDITNAAIGIFPIKCILLLDTYSPPPLLNFTHADLLILTGYKHIVPSLTQSSIEVRTSIPMGPYLHCGVANPATCVFCV